MSFTMYETTVPVMLRGLKILSGYLDKADAHAAANNISPAVLINARLAPDMLPLVAQVQRASDNAKGAIGRLASIEIPSFADTETTFAELKERIANTVTFLETITMQQLEGSASRPIELKFPSGSVTLSGSTYVLSMLLPNFFFHIATTHDILRHNGLKIGKKDYLGEFD